MFSAVCEQRRDSNLENQTRAIKCFPNGQGFILSSIVRVIFVIMDYENGLNKNQNLNIYILYNMDFIYIQFTNVYLECS